MTDMPADFPKTEPFKFSGQAGEFFGIWFVNHVLTMITFGIYSPWAKVRNLQYFYANTRLADASFQFTADPLSILKSRIIAVLLFVLYIVCDSLDSTLAKAVLIALVAGYFIFAPILTVYVMSFKLRYSAWKGIAFKFNKDFKGAYRVYLAPLVLVLLILASFWLPMNSKTVEAFFGMDPYVASDEPTTQAEAEAVEEPLAEIIPEEDMPMEEGGGEGVGAMEEEDDYVNPYLFIPTAVLMLLLLLSAPYFDFISNRFLARNARFGAAEFRYLASAGQYYALYAKALLITLLFIAAGAALAASGSGKGGNIMLMILLFMLYSPTIKAYMKSQRYNLLFNNIEIAGQFRVQANIPFSRFLFLLITNTIGVVLSFGLLSAWAKIRTAALMFEYTSLVANEPLDRFVAGQREESSALAEEVADVFDLELGL